MAGRNKWNNLMNQMSPDQRARIAQSVREDLTEMLLAEIRRLAGLTQEQLAGSLGIKQPTVSQLESQSDMQISTLRRIVEALGGELEIIATLPDRRISLSQFRDAGRNLQSARVPIAVDRCVAKHESAVTGSVSTLDFEANSS
jgi:transcriptional regulator with XRE-family HTH domain